MRRGLRTVLMAAQVACADLKQTTMLVEADHECNEVGLRYMATRAIISANSPHLLRQQGVLLGMLAMAVGVAALLVWTSIPWPRWEPVPLWGLTASASGITLLLIWAEFRGDNPWIRRPVALMGTFVITTVMLRLWPIQDEHPGLLSLLPYCMGNWSVLAVSRWMGYRLVRSHELLSTMGQVKQWTVSSLLMLMIYCGASFTVIMLATQGPQWWMSALISISLSGLYSGLIAILVLQPSWLSRLCCLLIGGLVIGLCFALITLGYLPTYFVWGAVGLGIGQALVLTILRIAGYRLIRIQVVTEPAQAM